MSSLTKIFVFLTLVFAIIVSVLVVVTLQRQAQYKSQVISATDQMNAALAGSTEKSLELEQAQQKSSAKDQTINKLINDAKASGDNANAQIAALQGQLQTAQANNAKMQNSLNDTTAISNALAQQNGAYVTEIQRLSPENVRLTRENAELSRANNELTTANNFAGQQIRKFQEQIAILTENAGKGGAAIPANDVNKVASLSVEPSGPINGKIDQVTPTAGQTLVELPLGIRDGVRTGSRFMVYRGQQYIADVVVEKVNPDVSIAAIDPATLKAGQKVQVGDMVMSAAK